ncbi:MAG TPA: hypothetical protein VMP01_19595 [Pirellulaceae bacterium]|nr:hypothetical protein [Pirellulaceae bacterium]
MQATAFDRDALANWYAEQHIKVDPGIRTVYYLPTNAPEREIRFVEVNELIGELRDEALEPLDFGVDRGMDSEHTLCMLDVTPNQWDRISQSTLPLPRNWSLENAVVFARS